MNLTKQEKKIIYTLLMIKHNTLVNLFSPTKNVEKRYNDLQKELQVIRNIAYKIKRQIN